MEIIKHNQIPEIAKELGEATYEEVKDLVKTEKLEPITVKGKAAPLSIYRVTGIK